MPRPHRHDGPDTWHHLLNRGVGRRTIFEHASDYEFFLSLLAREVREGRIELHGYSLMPNHFHLLVRSPRGELSEAMRRIQYRYARRFNRTRKRDGPLFRGRFKSRWIDSLRYRRNVMGYIHDNPVAAGIVANRSDYRWSSAHAWKDGRPPRWLAQGWVRDELGRHAPAPDVGWDEAMDAAFPGKIPEEHRAWIRRQLRDRHDEIAEDQQLKYAASPRVAEWMIRRAKLADGTRPMRPVCSRRSTSVVCASDHLGCRNGGTKRQDSTGHAIRSLAPASSGRRPHAPVRR